MSFYPPSRSILIPVLALFALAQALSADRIYVDAGATAGGDGASWATAYKYLQDALDQTVAGRGDEVWIAAGTYYPDDGANVSEGDRLASFTLKDGVELYGGFAGSETNRFDRDWGENIAMLSGKIFTEKIYWSMHVCTVAQDAVVELNGLTVSGGNANGEGEEARAGGVYSQSNFEITADNCIFRDNSASSGGGVTHGGDWTVSNCQFLDNSASSGGVTSVGNWTVSNSRFSGNEALIDGGVSWRGSWVISDSIFSQNSAGRNGGVSSGYSTGMWTVFNCIFFENSARDGGVAEWGEWTVINSIFSGNSVERDGGVAWRSQWLVANSSFSGNTANGGGAVGDGGSWTTLNNIYDATNIDGAGQIFASMVRFQNTTDTAPTPSSPRARNIIEGGLAVIGMSDTGVLDLGTGQSIDADPIFVNTSDPDGSDNEWGTADDGLRLQATSPAINQGNSEFLPLDAQDLDNDGFVDEQTPVDLAGYLRIQDDKLDLGAYEFGDSTAQLYTLALQSGEGGTTNPSDNQNYDSNAIVSVTASPSPGYLFVQWTGDASGGVNPLSVTMDQNRSITANFTPDLADPDADGLTNYQEIVIYGTNPDLSDSNDDGLSDGDVVSAGFDPTVDFGSLISLMGSKMEDARTGSTLLDVNASNALLRLQIERSTDLSNWSEDPEDIIEVEIPMSGGNSFFRFAIPRE